MKPFLIAGAALIVGGLVWAATRHDGFDPNAASFIADENGVHWHHWIDDNGIHFAEPEESIYSEAYGMTPSFESETHGGLVAQISSFALEHPLDAAPII